MTDLDDKLDTLTRNAYVLEAIVFERDIENKHTSLTKKLFLLSKIERANESIVDALKFLGLGSIEEIDDYKNENNL